MSKRKRISDRVKRERDRIRKRENRKHQSLPVVHGQMPKSVSPCRATHEDASDSPMDFLGHGSIGLPPMEEKPLAMVQASPSEKMHSNALSFVSSQGSLCAQDEGMALSPDSPPWVCTPPRVPELDTVHVSSSAGQTQLDMSSSNRDESIRIQKDTRSKTETVMYTVKNLNDFDEKQYDDYYISNMERKQQISSFGTENKELRCSFRTNAMGNFSCESQEYPSAIVMESVQGSFHQGDIMFENNAGTQCVANCLCSLAYHKVKNVKLWRTVDMNKVLVTGDEMYTFLQRSSSITSRYLLVEELPQLFECFNNSFELKVSESVTSLINLTNDSICYEDFNACTLEEALCVSLAGNDGCFVCFGGNTLLVGKCDDEYFVFDSHSRSTRGMLSVDGRSTRILLQNIDHVCVHLRSLALSMGYRRPVECELTGTSLAISRESGYLNCSKNESLKMGLTPHLGSEQNISDDGDNDVIYVTTVENPFNFVPLDDHEKRVLCEEIGIASKETDVEPISYYETELGGPNECREMFGDGNCFFRAISYVLSSSQEFHFEVRKAVCEHLLSNESLFESCVRLNENSVREHSMLMLQNGTWATELEILAVSHLLKVNIYTFSDGHWLQYTGQIVDCGTCKRNGSIYLYHKHGNHYDVVLSFWNTINFENRRLVFEQYCHTKKYEQKEKYEKIKDKQSQFDTESNRRRCLEKRKAKQRAKYRNNTEFRETKLRAAFVKYSEDESFRRSTRLANKIKFHSNLDYREATLTRSSTRYAGDELCRKKSQQASIKKYKENEVHKQNVKKKSIEKYKLDDSHRGDMKKRSILKYKADDVHKKNLKKRSIEKYKTDDDHRENLKKRSIEKYKTDDVHKENLKRRSRKKYKGDDFKIGLLKRANDKYKEDEAFRETVKARAKKYYHAGSANKANKKKNVMKQRNMRKKKLENEEEIINTFKSNAMKGPEYICCCCHRALFDNQVRLCDKRVYEKNLKSRPVAEICINDKYLHSCKSCCPENCSKSSLWICFTCHRKIVGGNIPAEAAANNMHLEDIPRELSDLNTLERHLISLHIPFMKVMSLPQGKQKNIHGPVVCVPSDLKKVKNLPLNSDENLILRVKLKRKLQFKGYFEYQFVNSRHISSALRYLKENNEWYKEVILDAVSEEYSEKELEDDQNDQTLDDGNENSAVEIDKNEFMTSDTCLQPVDVAQEVLDHYFDEIYSIAPGEGKNPVRILQEDGNEAKSFPYLFPSGNFSWNEERSVKITLAKYFNNRLMNADNRFAKDTSYIFFSQYLSELNQVIEKTQISVRKSLPKFTNGKEVTSQMLQDPTILSRLFKSDEALRFMQPIRGTPAYWSSAQKDLFAMLRQIGIPTWFCSFSAAEFRWNDSIRIILRCQDDDRDPDELDWTEKSEILRSNPVTVARMFEHKFHAFHRHVISSTAEPIGKVKDFFHRVEFQQRGSPHMHCLYWVENAPKLEDDGEDAVCEFIDKYVSCEIPSENEDAQLRKIVLDVQQHSKNHSRSCKKNGTECRFNFPRPPSQRTFIVKPVEKENEEDDDAEQLDLNKSQAKEILLNVWNQLLDDTNELHSTEDLFNCISLTQDLFELAYKVLSLKTATILKRNPSEVWTNQYNPCLLRCWDANMDIQYVLDPFSCIVYIISYISKSEREMGMLLKQTKVEAEEGNLSARETLKKIGSAYLHHREVSAQEAVYRVCNLKMKECSRKVVFIPVGENPTRLSKPLSQMKKKGKPIDISENEDMEEEEEDIWMTNIVERYENRPNLEIFNETCLAEFCSEYRVLAKSQVPDTEREGVYKLQNGKGYIQKRTRSLSAVVRYPRFSVEKAPEKYYQALIQLFLPHRNDMQLKPPDFDLYQSFYENGCVRICQGGALQSVKSIVNRNHCQFAKNEEMIESAQEMLEILGDAEDAWANLCPETEVKRRECISKKVTLQNVNENDAEAIPELNSEAEVSSLSYHVEQFNNSRTEFMPILRALNVKQRNILYLVREWCLDKIHGRKPDPLHIFVTGGAGTGKSHLIRAIQYESSRLFAKSLSTPDSISILLTAFTGTAAFNIGGSTIHQAFSLTKYLPLPYEPLKEQSLNSIRAKLDELQILVIDEVSMLYKRLLIYVHERLVQIKKSKEPFGGVSVIAVGDFYQLPPVKQRKDERLYKENMSYPIDFWCELFKIVELDEIMRQREDIPFANILNSLRVRTLDEPLSVETLNMLRNCMREPPHDILHVYSTNEEVNDYNLSMLTKSGEQIVQIDAMDYQKDRTSGKLILREKPITKSKQDGLSGSLLLSKNAKVMLVRNVNVEDGLVNGVIGHITHFDSDKSSASNAVKEIGVLFDKSVGKVMGKRCADGNIVLVRRIEEEITEKKIRNVVRHQFPLKLSWACTAHKVQGMTTNKVVVNLNRTFAPGQAYVALSRVTSKDGLFIEVEDQEMLQRKIYADADVKSSLLKMPHLCFSKNTNLNCTSIVLLNVQSLNAHFEDLKRDSRIWEANVVCLTETWLQAGSNTQRLAVEEFDFEHVSRNDSYDENNPVLDSIRSSKGGGVGIFRRKNEKAVFVPLKGENIECILLRLVDRNLIFVTVYKPQILSSKIFLQGLETVLDICKDQQCECVVLGDFNENLRENGPIQNFMENRGFNQLVNFSTTEGGTTLDHVYVPSSVTITVEKLPTYYSYHEGVLLNLLNS